MQDEVIKFFESNFISDQGGPISFRNRPYLKEIYAHSYPSLTLATSRQVGKSTFISLNMYYEAFRRPHNSLLYVTDQKSHMLDFRTRKIQKQRIMNPNPTLFLAQTNNQNELILSNGSILNFRAAGFSPDSTRGIPARKIYFDEYQAIDPGFTSVIMECARSFGDEASFVYCGTPLTFDDALWLSFSDSKASEWIVKCRACGKDNPPLGPDHIDVSRPFLFCVHCKKEMYISDGRWIAANPESKSYGYRISSLMDPLIEWSNPQGNGILDVFKRYPQYRFYNEVLGLPLDVGQNVLSLEEALACCEDEDFIDIDNPEPWLQGVHLFLAIDWAPHKEKDSAAFTCYALGMIYHGRVRVLYVKRFDDPRITPDEVLREIESIAERLPVKRIYTDYGGGHFENQRLDENLKKIVVEIDYSGNTDRGVWDAKRRVLKIDRTSSLDRVANKVKKRLFHFPRRDAIETFVEDLLGIKRLLTEEGRRAKYTKPRHRADDFFHLLNYLSLAVEHHHSLRIDY